LPAKDHYHDTVIHALKKAGWTRIDEQMAIIIEYRRLWIDIRAEKETERLAVLIEVKGFENPPSPIEYLAQATGKYALYRAALDYLQIDLPLYMAVPEAAYRGILSEEIRKQTLKQGGVRLLVFDPEQEEILAWIG
jgi:hypothetical protein